MFSIFLKDLMLCLGLVLPALSALGFSAFYLEALLLCALYIGFNFIYSALEKKKRFKRLLHLVYLLFVVFYPSEILSGLFDFLIKLFSGSSPVLSMYTDVFLRLLCVLAVELAYVFSRGNGELSLPLIILITGVCYAARPNQSLAFYVFSPLACLAVFALNAEGEAGSLSSSKKSRARALALRLLSMALIFGLALGLAPLDGRRSERLSKNAEEVKNKLNDSFFIVGNRDVFSLAQFGWQPKGAKLLGGKPKPNKLPLFKLNCEGRLYLKATSLDYYNGLAFMDSFPQRQYRYVDSRNERLRSELFCEGFNDILDEKKAKISLLQASTTTLYAPTRLKNIDTSGLNMNAYFSDSSELFIARNLREGDSYSLSFTQLLGTSAAKNMRGKKNIPLSNEQFQKYTQLPDVWKTNEDLKKFALELSKNAEDDFQRMLNIKNELRKRYKYSLDVEEPNSEVDFVSQFLFGSKEGYCTYFASAMTMLARLSGLPARFVSGFLSENGGTERLISGENAHAWCEIYFNDLGWVIFDATASDDEGQAGGSGEDDKGSNNGGSESDKKDNKTPKNSEKPDKSAENKQSLGRQGNEGRQDKSEADKADSNEEQNNQDKQDKENEKASNSLERQPQNKKSGLFLLLLALIAFLVYRYIDTRPRTYSRHFKGNSEKLEYFYLEHQRIYLMKGVKIPLASTLIEGAQDDRAREIFLPLSASVYGGLGVDNRSVSLAESYVLGLEKTLGFKEKLLLSLSRLKISRRDMALFTTFIKKWALKACKGLVSLLKKLRFK